MKKWLCLLMIVSFVGCSPKVVSYLNPKSNYKSFETYRLVSPKFDNKQVEGETSYIYDIVQENITAEMEKRSYQVSSISPNLTLRYELTSGTKVEVRQSSNPYDPFFRVNSRTIHEAIILLELFDQRNKLVWQGSYNLNQERKEKRVNKVISNAIARIFTTYPHKALTSKQDPSLTIYEKKKKK